MLSAGEKNCDLLIFVHIYKYGEVVTNVIHNVTVKPLN